jgi:LacI family transcriptional regulator
VTIQDIARTLNISHTTVSRALADNPKISAETKLRVRNAVEQLGYVPSASARMMRGARSSLVGLIIPDVQNTFYATLAKTVADCLAARSMQLLLSVTNDDSDRELRELRAILETRPAGVIIVPTAAARAETAALLKNVETVQLIRTHSLISARAMIVDDRAGTFAATQHLLSYGHRRLAFIGGDTSLSTGRNRLAGFEDALKERSLEPAIIALGPPRAGFAQHAVASMMAPKHRPTGLVFGSADLTLGALQGLRSDSNGRATCQWLDITIPHGLNWRQSASRLCACRSRTLRRLPQVCCSRVRPRKRCTTKIRTPPSTWNFRRRWPCAAQRPLGTDRAVRDKAALTQAKPQSGQIAVNTSRC